MGEELTLTALAAAVLRFLPRLGAAALLLLLAWLLGDAVKRLLARLARSRRLDPVLVRFIGQALRATLLVLGIVTALGTLGVDVSALVAGVGLTGFALGFAMKDMISNALAGVLVLMYKPFGAGDYVTVAGLSGIVAEVNFRYTVLDAEGKWICIPNANLFTNAVEVRKRGQGETAPPGPDVPPPVVPIPAPPTPEPARPAEGALREGPPPAP